MIRSKEKILENLDELHKFIILLADTNNEPIRGRLKLQKMMYFLSDRIEVIEEQSSYDAGNYGPYSEVIDAEAQYLEQIGLLTSGSGNITLTKDGKEIARILSRHEGEETLQILNEYKEFLNDMTSKELLAYFYLVYPDMTGKSVEYENLRPYMENHIMSLIKKQKISSQRAAELLKQPQYNIIKKMNEMGMITLR